jgi:hypothetical protein
MWAAICAALVLYAYFEGGIALVGAAALVIFVAASIAAVACTLGQSTASLFNRRKCPEGLETFPKRFVANFRRALVDGPIAALSYW